MKDAANVEGDERRAKAATRRLRASALRKSLESFVTHKWFDQFILGMIVLSSCLLAVDAPAEVDEGSRLKYWLDIFDAVFVGIFVVEAALKIVALGKRYFKNNWNVLDFCIVSLGVASAAIAALADAENGNNRRRGEDPPRVPRAGDRCASPAARAVCASWSARSSAPCPPSPTSRSCACSST